MKEGIAINHIVKKHGRLIIIGFLVVILGIVFIIRPITRETREFDIEDSCGPFMGSIVHTVQDEDFCEMRCISQCSANDFRFRKIKYEDGGLGCNTCTCLCIR